MLIKDALKKIRLSERDSSIAKKLFKGDKKESEWLKVLRKNFVIKGYVKSEPKKVDSKEVKKADDTVTQKSKNNKK